MREIKFRAFDNNKKRMGEVTDINLSSNQCYISWKGERFLAEPKYFPRDVIIMQYTGLKDKNGKEIYEGDVVIHNDSGRYKEVVFEEEIDDFDGGHNHSGFVLKDDENPWATDMVRCEVVGNIYENPDKLNK